MRTLALPELRQVALGLPEVQEVCSWGNTATFRVRNKIFVMSSEQSDQFTVKAAKGQQKELMASKPGTFSEAAYVGRFGWVAVRYVGVDEKELTELLTEAWRQTAPAALIATSGR